MGRICFEFTGEKQLIRQLTIEETEKIYEKYMREDFPASELKSLSVIEDSMNRGNGKTLGMFDENGNLQGYAIIVTHGETALLDYYAVRKELRGKGVGSSFLQELKTSFFQKTVLYVEAEDSDFSAGKQKLIQAKRLSFYEKNGIYSTGLSLYVYGVIYRILCTKKNVSAKEAYDTLISIYQTFREDPSWIQKETYVVRMM